MSENNKIQPGTGGKHYIPYGNDRYTLVNIDNGNMEISLEEAVKDVELFVKITI